MFLTNNSAKAPIDEALTSPGTHLWSYVTIAVDRPFFLACYRLDNQICNDLMSSVWQVRQLVCEPDVSLDGVQLIVGPEDSNDVKWAMRPLRSVLVGKEPSLEEPQESLIYVLQDGSTFVDSVCGSEGTDLVDIEEWFSI